MLNAVGVRFSLVAVQSCEKSWLQAGQGASTASNRGNTNPPPITGQVNLMTFLIPNLGPLIAASFINSQLLEQVN